MAYKKWTAFAIAFLAITIACFFVGYAKDYDREIETKHQIEEYKEEKAKEAFQKNYADYFEGCSTIDDLTEEEKQLVYDYIKSSYKSFSEFMEAEHPEYK